MKLLAFVTLFLLNQASFAKEVKIITPAKEEKSFLSIFGDIESLGEYKIETKNELPLQEALIDLMSWKPNNKKEKLELSSGIFLIHGFKKSTKNHSKEDLKHFYDRDTKYYFTSNSFGTGFLYKNYIVTNYHVCRGQNALIKDFNNNAYPVKVLVFSVKQDICIFKAPTAVMDQRNFNDFKMPANSLEEELYALRLENEELKLSSKPNKTESDTAMLQLLKLKKNSEKRDYGYISSIYGEDYIYKIRKDMIEDQFSKENGFLANGSKCISGASGSPIVSKTGIIGLFWGAESIDALERRSLALNKRSPSYEKDKKSECSFLAIEEVEKVINTIPST